MKTKNTPFRALPLILAALVLASLFLAVPGPLVEAAEPTPSPVLTRAPENCQVFPQTGFTTCGLFLQYWKAHGGLSQQGYPISGVFYERNLPPPSGDGQLHLVQYFQRARFEYHPENRPPYQVLLGLLGTTQYSSKYKVAPKPDETYYNGRTDCEMFTQTGFQVCGRFLEYWKANGGLGQQGYPISPVIMEENAPPPAGDGKIHPVQYFQRARFEQHSENTRPYDALLGLLGAEQYQDKYSLSPPEFLNNNIPPPAPGPGEDIIPASGCLPAKEGGGPDGPTTIQACIPDSAPLKESSVTVYGRLISNGQALAGASFDATWRFSKTTATCSGFSNNSGVASCSINLAGKAVAGSPVTIDITMSYNGSQMSKVSIAFTPR